MNERLNPPSPAPRRGNVAGNRVVKPAPYMERGKPRPANLRPDPNAKPWTQPKGPKHRGPSHGSDPEE